MTLLNRLEVVGRATGRNASAWRLAGLAGVLGVLAIVCVNLAISAMEPPAEAASPQSLPRPKGGSLLICGGGKLSDLIRDRFVQLAGGSDAKIVFIPTALRDANRPRFTLNLDAWKNQHVASIRILHTLSRATANDPAFVKPLAEATGVWLCGGNQNVLTEVYADTEVERQLKGLLDRGGTIGGTSAGASAMTRVMIAGGRDRAQTGRGFDLLPGAVVDQHFLRRNRVSRLVDVLSDHPDLVGFGIDEGTALWIDLKARRLSVLGDSYVFAYVPAASNRPERFEIMKAGDEANLSALQGSGNAVVSRIDL
ncbi:MAG: cyanophycinase [Planctomycetota bacterium]|nr:cyanophycinase [Planctomycetota bacterium]